MLRFASIKLFQFSETKNSLQETDISNHKLKKSPFFENLKNINPKFSVVSGNDSTRKKVNRNLEYRRKSDTFIVDHREKRSEWQGVNDGLRLECNKENELENSVSPSECTDDLYKTNRTGCHAKTMLDVLNTDSDGDVFHGSDTETCQDEIVIFERAEYRCPKEEKFEKSKSVHRSVNVQKVITVLGICLLILLLIWLVLYFKMGHNFLNYFKIKKKRQPTNYEVSLLMLKNVCRLIYSGVDMVRYIW